MQRETKTRLRYTLNLLEKTFAILSYSKALATKHRASSKSLLFLALACLKNLGVLVILSSEELLALVILVSYAGLYYVTALLRA
ncbi:hypothetical protein HBH76_102070 [Parastagonospora nodorum]|nr:hypothetical protein HBH76_102070 [Parastagonospora nodorum]